MDGDHMCVRVCVFVYRHSSSPNELAFGSICPSGCDRGPRKQLPYEFPLSRLPHDIFSQRLIPGNLYYTIPIYIRKTRATGIFRQKCRFPRVPCISISLAASYWPIARKAVKSRIHIHARDVNGIHCAQLGLGSVYTHIYTMF